MTLIDRSFRERIVLVGVVFPGVQPDQVDDDLDELALLIDTAGADEAGRVVQKRDKPDPATFVGRGKAEELRALSLQVDADTVVFDEELTPAQQRNLEQILGRTAIDRTAVILDIFAQNAHTQEGKTQVELALLHYRLPRLRGRGVTFSQQAGGIGTRGPGETQLEVDRRRLLKRITKLEHDLKSLRRTRATQRKARTRSRVRTVSLVGYTNAGKSTLLNRFTDAGVKVENRLFSTVDATTRRTTLPGGEPVLLSDTVGFVRKLPHELVEAFRSTLEEVTESDLLLHVVSAAAPDPEAHLDAVQSVLREIGADHIPQLVVVNKVDLLEPRTALKTWMERHEAVGVSAVTGEGMEELGLALRERLHAMSNVVQLIIPFDRGDVVAALHRESEVLEERHDGDASHIVARIEFSAMAQFAPFLA